MGPEDTIQDKPLVSVLVLSYRNIDGIWSTLDSILSQDYPKLEIVVSDDGTEGFEGFAPGIERYIAENNHGNVVNTDIHSLEVNQGTVKNANAAVKKSHGDYIKTISPDDCFSCDDAISKYVSFMQAEGCLVAFAKLRGVDDKGCFVDKLASCEDDYDMLRRCSPEEISNKLYARNILPGAAEFFDCRVFEQHGLFPEGIRLIEDYPYWLHLSMRGVRFGFLDEVLVDYRLSGVSSAGHYSVAFMRDMYAIYDGYIFPNDRRFGAVQPLYNKLKRWGLDYYMAEARRDEMSAAGRILNRVRYLPFHLAAKLMR